MDQDIGTKLTTTVKTLAAPSTVQDAPDKEIATTTTTSTTTTSTTTRTKEDDGSATALIISASDKAGMEGIERDRINSIILRESGKSSFMVHQRKKDDNVNEKISKMQQKLSIYEANPSFVSWQNENEKNLPLQSRVNSFLRTRRTTCTHVVVDMDSFYISCELLSKPELRDVPACVGRGMVLTSNYCARRYGVRSAMAGFIADKLVSELSNGKERLHHVPANFDLYTEKSKLMKQALSEYDPYLKAYSLDEAYLNIGPYLDLRIVKGWSHERSSSFLLSRTRANTSEEQSSANISIESKDEHEEEIQCKQMINLESANLILSEMREKVKIITGGLTCSAGIAPNFMLAKIASDMNKPDGQLLIPPNHEDIMKFLYGLPVRKISGIGRVTEKILKAFNIHSGGDLYKQRSKVAYLFQTATASFLLRASLGWQDDDDDDDDDDDFDKGNDTSKGEKRKMDNIERKGISRERTFPPESIYKNIQTKLDQIAHLLANDMYERRLKARTITLKIKLKTFEVFSKSKSLPIGQAFQCADDMIPVLLSLLDDVKRECLQQQKQNKKQKQPPSSSFILRLMGVRCSNFCGQEEQKRMRQMEHMNIEQFMSSQCEQSSKTKNNVHQYTPVKLHHKKQSNHRIPELFFQSRVNQNNQNNQNHANTCEKNDLEKASNIPNNLYKPTNSPVHSPQLNVAKSTVESKSTASITSLQSPPKQTRLNALLKPKSPATIDSTISFNFSCPICHKNLSTNDNDLLNQHIDACLNGPLVRKMIRQESSQHVNLNRKKSLTHFFSKM